MNLIRSGIVLEDGKTKTHVLTVSVFPRLRLEIFYGCNHHKYCYQNTIFRTDVNVL